MMTFLLQIQVPKLVYISPRVIIKIVTKTSILMAITHFPLHKLGVVAIVGVFCW